MSARPTHRQPATTVDKLHTKVGNTVKNSAIFKPIDDVITTLARKAIHQALSRVQSGRITLIETYQSGRDTPLTWGEAMATAPNHPNDNSSHESHNPSSNSPSSKSSGGNSSAVPGPQDLAVTLSIHDRRVYRQLLLRGSIGLADSYINGEWDCDDLTALIRLAARNVAVLNTLEDRFAVLNKTIERFKHRRRDNDRSGAKSNILAHYDLGNEMYQRFLDETMMYSAAVYPHEAASLSAAQQHKLALICQRLQLSSDDHVIEIGTGWGGFAIYAATHYGCQVTTTTISDAQYEEAQRRLQAAGLSDKITVLKQDYRELTGQYDKLVSIEMIEAVGHEYLPTFFATCNRLLKPTGLMVLQAITFNDQHYASYINSVDFIQTHIFPGGCLLSNQEIITQFTEQTDMVVKQLQDYGYDYAHTLRDWRHAFLAKREEIRTLGYDEAFIRLWTFYFCYCEGGFLERTIGVVQVTAVKPLNYDRLQIG